jgi:hypothetical protein
METTGEKICILRVYVQFELDLLRISPPAENFGYPWHAALSAINGVQHKNIGANEDATPWSSSYNLWFTVSVLLHLFREQVVCAAINTQRSAEMEAPYGRVDNDQTVSYRIPLLSRINAYDEFKFV